MTDDNSVDALLAGPRGRRLCLALVEDASGRAFSSAVHGYGPAPVDALRGAVAAADLQALRDTTDPAALMPALSFSVSTAMYWQPPDEADSALADPLLAELLRPVAEGVLASPAAAWWSRPGSLNDQRHVEQVFRHSDLSLPTGAAAEALRRWRDDMVAWERTAEAAWRDRGATGSREWWSTPPWSAAMRTTPSVPAAALAVGMVLIEESAGDADVIRTREVRIRPDARVYELTGPQAWSDLVEAHPLPVTSLHRQDWGETTGRGGPWVTPDWAAVAREWDGVHLTVTGYLATAGRALPAAGAHTLLAGWSPDLTCWFTDVVQSVGEPTTWRWPDRDDVLGWQRT